MATRTYMPALDGLRAIAFLQVFFFHALWRLKDISGGERLLSLLRPFVFGWAGVDLFFVLSGFLITLGLVKSLDKAGYFKRFYIKRLLRIFPLYYATIFAVFLALPMVYPNAPKTYPGLYENSLAFVFNVQNWVMALTTTDLSVLSHFWSLAIEEQFYLIWPFSVLLLPRGQKAALACFSVAGLILLLRCWITLCYLDSPTINRFLHNSTLTRADALLMGAGLAYYLHYRKEAPSFSYCFNRALMLLIPVALFLIIVWPTTPRTQIMYSIGYSVMAIGAVALVLVFHHESCDSSALANPTLRYIGKISYGLYVYHWPIQLGTVIVFQKLGWYGEEWGIAYLILTGVLTFAVSAVSFHVFESPFLRLKARFAGPPATIVS